MSAATRRFRALPAVAILAAATLALAACSDGSGGTGADLDAADPTAPVELTWWTGQSADAETLLEALGKEFTELHPNVKLNISSGASTTDELLQKMSAGFASGKYPDMSYAFGSWTSALAESGKTLDITTQVADPAVGWSEFPAAATATASPGGVTLGFPAIVDNLALFYNPTLFDDAGLAYPNENWTWDDFRAAAKAITNPEKKVYGTAFSVSASEDTTWHMWPQLWQNGGSILSDDQKQATFNSPAGVAAADYWRALAVDDKSVYLDQTDEKYGPLFVSGQIGMIITGPWQLYDLSVAKAKYGVTILPGTNGDHQTVSGPDVWVLLDHGDANRAYWSFELAKWLTSKEVDVRWNLAQGNLPLRTSEAETPEFAQYVKDYPGADVLFANLANAKQPRPTVVGYVEMSRYFGEAISAILQDAAETQAALDEAATKSEPALSGL